MQPLSPQRKRLIFIGAGVFALILVVSIIFSAIQIANRGPFYVTDTTPVANRDYTVPINPQFIIKFNHDIKPVDASQVSSDPKNDYRVETSGKTLSIIPKNGFLLGQYKLTLKDIASTDGYNIKEYVLPFNIVGDSGSSNAQITAQKYPITSVLPHYDDAGWVLRLPGSGLFEDPPSGYAMPFFVYVDTPLTDSQMRDSVAAQHAALEETRALIVQFITSKGYKMEDYAFKYTDPYLQSKFGTTQPRMPALTP